ncbi:MAG: glycosyltransferase [Gammaproteobacteria bacterium]|nr:glycosyltransferase [Gammaproteobacteria bacterium]
MVAVKISIITVVRNAASTIEDTLQSLQAQTHPDVEHIVIDGASTDGTLAILQRHQNRISELVSEPDGGIYHAMNKGLALATGDVIGLLNSDDIYADNTVLAQVAAAHGDAALDACYADLVYVKPNDMADVVRHWRSQPHRPGLCFDGWMPAHPTLFLKKRVYELAGGFDTSLRYQSDLEFCARIFEIHKISSRYIPKLWVRMRLGGVTNNSFSGLARGNWESYQALKKLGLRRNPISYFAIKFSSRLKQYLP